MIELRCFSFFQYFSSDYFIAGWHVKGQSWNSRVRLNTHIFGEVSYVNSTNRISFLCKLCQLFRYIYNPLDTHIFDELSYVNCANSSDILIILFVFNVLEGFPGNHLKAIQNIYMKTWHNGNSYDTPYYDKIPVEGRRVRLMSLAARDFAQCRSRWQFRFRLSPSLGELLKSTIEKVLKKGKYININAIVDVLWDFLVCS